MSLFKPTKQVDPALWSEKDFIGMVGLLPSQPDQELQLTSMRVDGVITHHMAVHDQHSQTTIGKSFKNVELPSNNLQSSHIDARSAQDSIGKVDVKFREEDVSRRLVGSEKTVDDVSTTNFEVESERILI